MAKATSPARPSAGEPVITASNLSLMLGRRTVLTDIDLAVGHGEIVTLIGPNGAGKTTLVRALLGLVRPSAGDVWRRRGLRLGYMPQRLQVDPTLPLTVRRFLAMSGVRRRADIRAALEETGVAARETADLAACSGGEVQRVLLARALLRRPDVLVLDEPVQGVDVHGQAALFRLIRSIRDRYGCAVIMVSHDLHLVMAATDRVVCINGHVCCAGHPETVSRHPAYRALFGDPAAEELAVYAHHHDHVHDADGAVLARRLDGG